jgi:hypothetical protein
MYLFAHLFTGILLGLGFCHLCKDRRLVLVCIAGSLFPDVLDKSLRFIIPGLFGSTRTIGHTLSLAVLIGIAALIVWYHSRSVIGIAFAGTVLIHQVLDMMWTLPVTWFFPLHGMFPVVPVPGGFLPLLWIELTNSSEWVFAAASCIVVLIGYAGVPGSGLPSLSGRSIRLMQYGTAILLGITGACLIIAGPGPFSGTVPALYAGLDKTLMAGLVALSGAVVLVLIYGLKQPVLR